MPIFLLVGGVIGAVFGAYGLSLATTARPRWPRFVAVEPTRAWRWRGAALLWLAPSVVCLATSWQVGPMAGAVWLVAANVTQALGWTCLLVGELVRFPDGRTHSAGSGWIGLGLAFILGAGVAVAMAAGDPRQFVVTLGYAGPTIPLGVLAIAVGVRLRRLSPRRSATAPPGWPLPPPWGSSPPGLP